MQDLIAGVRVATNGDAAPPQDTGAGPGTREYAASFGQQRLWIIDRLKPENSVYNITLVADLAGPLNLFALEASFAEIVRRHDGLRTRFRVRGGRPLQEVRERLHTNIAIIDLRNLSPAAQTQAAGSVVRQLADKPFKLDRSPLFSLSLVALGPRQHVLVFTVHHIIFDHWSQEIVVREFAQLYAAYSQGQPIGLPKPAMQYADFSEMQRKKLDGAALERLLDFWRRQIGASDSLPANCLPFRRGADLHMQFAGKTMSATLSGEVLNSLRSLARKSGKSLFAVTLTAFIIVMRRYTQGGKTLVTVPVSSRDTLGVEGVVGLMLNLLPLSIEIDARDSFEAALQKVSNHYLAALENQDLPFEKIVEALDPQRYHGGTRLSQLVFGYRRKSASNFQIGGLNITPRDLAGSHAKFELSAMIVERGGAMDVSLEYNSECFDEADIQRFFGNYLTTLTELPARSQAPLENLALLNPAEEQLQLREWNGTAQDAGWTGGVVSEIEDVARRQPDAVAVRCGDATLRYGELARRSGRVAGWLRKQGAGPETLIGVCVERSIETVVALLGVLKSGAAYVALDAHGPAERTRELIAEAGLQWVLVSDRKKAAELSGICKVADIEQVSREGSWARGPIEPEALAYVLFTSGSTGRPKGVMVSQRNLAASTRARRSYYQHPVERFLMLSPFFFDSSAAGLYWSLTGGGCLVIPVEGEQRDGARLAQLCSEEAITHLLCIPSLYQVLLESLDQAALALQVAIVAGEACGAKLVSEHQQKLGAAVKLCNEYGPTEGTVWSTVSELSAGDAAPIGRAVGTLRAYVCDEPGQLLPVGAQGEIVIGGSGVARGYWRDARATAEKFVPDRWSGAGRGYRTGDWGRWRGDGQLLFEGRRDDEVKIRGHRLSLGEVESLLREQDGVVEAAAAVRQQGSGAQLLAFVVLKPGAQLNGETLRGRLRQRLPDAVVPAQVHVLAALPTLPNGKLDRHRLLENPQLDHASNGAHESVLDPIEGLIADVWKEILGRESIDLDDNFFEIGGHSLLATQVLSRLRSLFDRSIVLRTFFENPTLRGIAGQIKRAQLAASLHDDMPEIRLRAKRERPPLSFQQQRLWYLYEANRASVDYHLPRAVRLRGPLAADALERAICEIVRRHEILRTSFGAEYGRPFMIVNAPPRACLPVCDVPGSTLEDRLNTVARLIDEQVRRPFVLEDEAVRFILYRLGAEDHVLFTNMHHIVTDGWSLGVLTNELQRLFADFKDGRTNSLPELPFQYADFSAWQREWLQGSRLDRYVDYWEKELEGAAAGALPLKSDGATRESFAGRSLQFNTGPEVAAQLRSLCRETGSTLYMVLQSLFAASVAWHSGAPDVVIGTSVANRRDVRTEGLIGFFSNTLPIRTRFDAECTYRSLIKGARQAALKAFALEDVPIESIVSRLRRKGALGAGAALFDTFFVLHNEPIQPLALAGLHTEFLEIQHPTTMFKLAGSVAEKESGLAYMLHYDSNYLSGETVAALARSFEQLLAAAAATPDQLVFDTLAEQTPAEQRAPFSGTFQLN